MKSKFLLSFSCFTFSRTIPVFTALVKEALENIVEKGENWVNCIFSISHNVFLPFPKQKSVVLDTFILLPANALKLDRCKILPSGKGLIQLHKVTRI